MFKLCQCGVAYIQDSENKDNTIIRIADLEREGGKMCYSTSKKFI